MYFVYKGKLLRKRIGKLLFLCGTETCSSNLTWGNSLKCFYIVCLWLESDWLVTMHFGSPCFERQYDKITYFPKITDNVLEVIFFNILESN